MRLFLLCLVRGRIKTVFLGKTQTAVKNLLNAFANLCLQRHNYQFVLIFLCGTWFENTSSSSGDDIGFQCKSQGFSHGLQVKSENLLRGQKSKESYHYFPFSMVDVYKYFGSFEHETNIPQRTPLSLKETFINS